MSKSIVTFVIFLFVVNFGLCAKILGVFNAPTQSHYILGSSLLRALAEKGHDVTMISCFGEKEPPKNGSYRDIVVPEIHQLLLEQQEKEKTTIFDRAGVNPFVASIYVAYSIPKILEPTLQNKDVQKLIHSGEKFDVVIVEQFLNDAMKALATHFEAPLVILSTLGANHWINELVGNPAPLSYIPQLMLDFSVPMSFSERAANTLSALFNQAYYRFYVYPKQNDLIKKSIPNGPDLFDVMYNVSLVLLNSHPSLNQPVPYVPNMIDIGGFHVKPPKKLPQDLQDFLDNSPNGVVYFSMGSRLKSAQLPVEKRDSILKTFSKLKQNVLWKWEDDDLPGQPANVKLGKWLPQQDILAHPNVKLFITHGGFLSTTEAVYHGVPILAIPIFGDQVTNAKSAEKQGFGLMLPYQEISENKLTELIFELLNNQKYKENVETRSKIFHDRPVTPMENAIYWVEYVIRHKGAPHLRVAGLDLPWYKYHLLDVIAFLAFVIFVSCYAVKLVLSKLCSKRRSNKLKAA